MSSVKVIIDLYTHLSRVTLAFIALTHRTIFFQFIIQINIQLYGGSLQISYMLKGPSQILATMIKILQRTVIKS